MTCAIRPTTKSLCSGFWRDATKLDPMNGGGAPGAEPGAPPFVDRPDWQIVDVIGLSAMSSELD